MEKTGKRYFCLQAGKGKSPFPLSVHKTTSFRITAQDSTSCHVNAERGGFLTGFPIIISSSFVGFQPA